MSLTRSWTGSIGSVRCGSLLEDVELVKVRQAEAGGSGMLITRASLCRDYCVAARAAEVVGSLVVQIG